MSQHQLGKDVGELSFAFQCNDMTKMVQLTKGLPARARGCLHSIVDVYQKKRSSGMTPLISAILHNNVQVAEMLIREKVDMGQQLGKDFRRVTELAEMEVIYMNANMQIIRGPTEDVFKDFKLATPMFWAIKSNNLYIVEKIVKCPTFEKDSFVETINGMPALMFAVLENNIAACQILMDQKVDVHAADFNGGRALDVAIDRNLEEMVRFLLANGENVNCSKHNKSPLIYAIDNDSIRLMEVLIEKGASVNSAHVRNSPLRPLHYAIGMQKFEVAKFLIKKGANVDAPENHGITAFQLLARIRLDEPNADKLVADIVEMAKFFVTHKADVNIQNAMNETVLHIAANYMNVKLVKYLLSVKARVNVKNHSLQSPLHAAIIPSNATKAIVTVTANAQIKRHAEGGLTVNTPYIVPNQKKLVKLLINAGADINSRDQRHHTPLFLAVGNNNLEMVELLISLGADVNTKNADGYALLHIATRENNLNIVKCLINGGKAHVNVKTSKGETPLHIAVFNKYTEIVECLLNAKADARVENEGHATPLGMAVAGNSPKLTKMIAKAGADVNSQTPDGTSYLHLALEYYFTKSAKSLLELGANINITDSNGVTPLMIAIINLNYKADYIQLLLDYGADPLHCCRIGMNAYRCVIGRHEADLLKLFWRYGCPTNELERPPMKKLIFDAAPLFRNHENSVFFSNASINNEEKKLRTAQSSFLEGIVENNPIKVKDAIKIGAVTRGGSHNIKYPLHYAVKSGFREVAEILLNNGVPANSVDNNFDTPLEMAALAEDWAMCMTLLSNGACYYSGLENTIFHYNMKVDQVERACDALINKKEKFDQTNKMVGNLTMSRQKLVKKSKELKKQKKGQQRRQTHKELREIEQKMNSYRKQQETQAESFKEDLFSAQAKADEVEPLYSFMGLLLIIRKLFWLIRKQDRRHRAIAMVLIEKSLKDSIAPFCKSLLNAVDKKGKTIMGAAIESGNSEMTEYLMKIRLEHCKMIASD